MSDRVIHINQYSRANGLTTLMLDVAICNAKVGKHIEHWSIDYSRSQHAFRMFLRRIADMKLQGVKVGQNSAQFESGGFIDFRHGRPKNRPPDPPSAWKRCDVSLYDFDEQGEVVVHT